MRKRRRKARIGRFGDAGQEGFFRNVLAALQASEQARGAKSCKAAFRTFNEAELYQGRATLALLANDRSTLDMKKALSQSRRELGITRERLVTRCRV
jgi:hypothetical protein